MAVKSPAVSRREDPLEKEANDRLADARKQKTEFELDIREGYFFAAPHRSRQVTSTAAPQLSKLQASGETTTSFACELTSDFSTVVMDAFMPQAEPWCERRPGIDLTEEQLAEVQEAVKKQDPQIFNAMRSSNLYAEIPKSFTPDLSIGTFAFWIDDPRPSENLVVQAIPLRELEVNLGPFGEIDDRFAIRHTKYRHVPALLPGVDLPPDIKEKVENKGNERCEVRWGFWRLWDRTDDTVWQRVIMVGNRRVDDNADDKGLLVGEGCCPLIAGRFNPSPDWAYGWGPLLQSLPDLRQLDTLEEEKLTTVEFRARPPFKYPDDSFANIENGIEAGAGYPVRPGSGQDVGAMFEVGSADAAIFVTSELERRLRKLFYLDWPEQRGDTPPTATQWLDQMTMAQRRLGLPGMSFWKEGPAQIFLRFKYLLEKRGKIEPITVNGKIVSLEPYNPAQRAAEQQEVAMATRFGEIGAGLFPEEFKVRVDGGKTLVNIAKRMRVDGLISFRDEKKIQEAVEQIAPLVGAQPGRFNPAG